MISAQLCPHCCRVEPPECILNAHKASSLKALSQTCTIFRDIAQPLLYHIPAIRSYHCFLRTIRERPDLAGNVKYLPALRKPHKLDPDMVADKFMLVKELAAGLQMYTSQDMPFDDEFSSMLLYLYSGRDTDNQHSYAGELEIAEFYILLHAILIALLPCMEVLYIDGWQEDSHFPVEMYHHAKRRLARVGRFVSDRCEGPSIPSLHTIVIGDWREYHYY